MNRIRGVLLFLVAGATMLAIKFSLRTVGFGRTTWLVRRLSRLRLMRVAPSEERVSEIARVVASVGAVCPARARCLEQSFTLVTILRWLCVPAVMRMGAQPFPFVAHAWVEIEGRRLGPLDAWYADLTPFELTL